MSQHDKPARPVVSIHAVKLPRHLEKQSAFYKLRKLKQALTVVGLLTSVAGLGYVGFEAWRRGMAGVEQAQVMSQGQQIVGASKVHKLQDPQDPHTFEHLVSEGYLKQTPQGWVLGPNGVAYEKPQVRPEVCAKVNEKAGLVGPKTVVEEVNDPTKEQTASFGCVVETSTVFFKN